jgi:1-acyl-sn-glycerol-3-phosphate acyltransferase
LGRWLELLFTRTTISGLENIPGEGPVLFTPNHASTYDALLMLVHLPPDAHFVGPGDFKLLWPGNVAVKRLGLILTNRGSVDRHSLKQMEAVLKNNGRLALFPEGGTWEKGLHDVKPGAAYLSLVGQARIVPIALGGTYQVWKRISRLQRPRITIRFDEPLPPVEISGDRKTRQAELQQASYRLMERIYAMLPAEDQRRYDEDPRRRFWADVTFMPGVLTLENPPAFSGLAELVSKPNLFSPLHRNAGLPLRPFVQRLDRFTPADQFQRAVLALQQALNGDFQGYLEYRLGDEKAALVRSDLQALMPVIERAIDGDLAMRFTPHVRLISPLDG